VIILLRYVLTYSLFVFFVLYLITLGAPDIVTGEAKEKIMNITVPTQSRWESVPVIGPVYGFFRGVYNTLSIFYTLLKFSSGVRWLTTVLITPLMIGLVYVIIRILRGGG